jgi:putative transposase
MRRRFALRLYGYVVMPDHVLLLLSEPQRGLLADAMHYVKLSFAKRLVALVRAPHLGANLGNPSKPLVTRVFWQKRYYERNVRNEHEFTEKLRYIRRNQVKAGLCERPEDWQRSSFRHYALREKGVVEIESEWTERDRESQAQRSTESLFLITG